MCVCEAIGAPSRLMRKDVWPLWDVKTELFIEMSHSNVTTEAFFVFFKWQFSVLALNLNIGLTLPKQDTSVRFGLASNRRIGSETDAEDLLVEH